MNVSESVDRLITQERLRLYPISILVVTAITYAVTLASGALETVTPDFLAHWTGGRLLLDGSNDLFDRGAQLAIEQEATGTQTLSWFVSPPYVAALYAPLAALPYSVAAALWSLISAACLVAATALAKPFAPDLLTKHRRTTLLILASSQPVFEALGAGQQSALSLLLWVAGIRLFLEQREVAGGAVLALGLFKPQLVVLVPLVFLLRRQWSALAAFAAVGLGFAALSVGIVGIDGVADWLRIPTSDTYHAAVTVDQAWKMVSLPALGLGLLPWDGVAQYLTWVIGALCVVVFMRQVISVSRPMDVWTLTLLATVVASPHLAVYDLMIAFPAFLWMAQNANSRGFRLLMLAIYFLAWTSPVRHAMAGGASWPLSMVDAAWTAVPVAALWWLWSTSMTQPRAEP